MLRLVKKLVPGFLLSWYHFLWAFFGALLYGFPTRNMTVIGVTGTNGKSTTVDMISRIFREAGLKTASLSSIRFQILDKEWRNTMKMTMPGRFVIQEFLREAKNAGCTHVVLEVTSEGILQHRHRFTNFHTAVFTNLSPEHIERHGSFEKYREAKGKLFAAAKQVHVVNKDDAQALYFEQFPAVKKIFYSLSQAQEFQIHLKLLGEFNVYNAFAAISVGLSQGVSLETCKRALEKIEGIPGRMEVVIKEPFRVIVDYAFTPAALEKVYKTFRENPKSPPDFAWAKSRRAGEIRNPKLICVLGAAGGGRDKWKRPVLGKIAATHCDRVIITNEDPYEEDPEKIINEVHGGTQGKGEIILDRREAIKTALSQAHPGDVVVITGKGSEDSIAVRGGKKIPWDDREVVREEMRARGDYPLTTSDASCYN